MAGTSVVQFLNDLANPMSKRAKDTLKQMGLTLGDLRIRTHGLTGVVRNLRAGYGRLNEVQQERAAMNLGDIRSARVINALIQDQTGRLDELIEASRNANGEAEEMARKRLVNLTGAFKMAGNSAKVFWSELFNERVLTSAASVVGGAVDKLNQVTWVLGALNRNEDPFETIAKNAQVVGSIGEFMGGRSGFLDPKQAVAIGRGIYEGFQWFRDAVVSMVDTVKSALERLGLSRFTGEGAQDFARLATAGTLLAAVLGPVLLGLGGAAFAAGGLFKVLGGGTDIVGGLAGGFSVLAGSGNVLSGLMKMLRVQGRDGLGRFTGLQDLPVGMPDPKAAKAEFLAKLGEANLGRTKTAFATSLFNLAQLPTDTASEAAKGIGKAMLGINPITQKAAAGMAKFGRQTELGAALLWNTTPALRKFGSQFTIAGRAIQQTAGPALHSFGAAVATVGTAAKGVGGRVVNVLAKVGAPIASIFSPLMPAVTGIGSALGAAFGPVLGFLGPIAAVVGIAAGVFLLLRKRGESVGDTFKRIGGGLVGGIMAAVGALPALFAQAKEAIKPLIEGILAVSEPIAEVFQQVVGGLLPIIGSVAKLIFGVIGSVAKAVFALAGGLLKAVGAVLRPVMSLVRHVFPLVKAFFTIQATVLKIGVVIVGALAKALGRLVLPIVEKIGDWFSKFGPMLRPIGDILLWPFKKLSGWLADLLRSLAGTPLLRSLGLDVGEIRKLILDLEGVSGRQRTPTLVQERVAQGMPLGPGAPMTQAETKVRPLWGSSYLGSPDVIVGPAPRSTVDVSGLLDTAAQNRGAAAAAPNVHVTVVDKTKTELHNETSFNVDGSEVAHAVSRRMLDVRDRAGAQSTPWQRRFVVEHGVAPA